jgi:prophage antirepressor-like protein
MIPMASDQPTVTPAPPATPEQLRSLYDQAVAATVATVSPAEPAPAAPGVQELVRNAFEGHEITTVTYQGRPVVLANQVGDALGYSDRGLVTTITRDWSDEMTEGKDYLKVTNGNLRDLKAVLGLVEESSTSGPAPLAPRAPSAIVLTESGFGFVCIKTEKPLGKRLRREWADRIFPSLMRPELAPPPVPSPDLTAVQGELARLRAQMDELQQQLSSGSRPVRTAPAQGTLPLLPEASGAGTPPALQAFVALWLARDGGAWSSVAQLLPLAQEAGLVGPNHYPGHRAQLCRLGKLLSAQPQLAEHQVVRRTPRRSGDGGTRSWGDRCAGVGPVRGAPPAPAGPP